MPGWAYSGYHFYEILKGCANELADKHIPQVEPRQDTLAGPKGRRADTVSSLSFNIFLPTIHCLFVTMRDYSVYKYFEQYKIVTMLACLPSLQVHALSCMELKANNVDVSSLGMEPHHSIVAFCRWECPF